MSKNSMDIDWNKTKLRRFLLRDNWVSDDALDILAGFDPEASFLPPDISGFVEANCLNKITALFAWPEYRDNNPSFEWDNIDDQELYDIFLKTRKYHEDISDIWGHSDFELEDFEFRAWGDGHNLPRPPKVFIDYFVKKLFIFINT